MGTHRPAVCGRSSNDGAMAAGVTLPHPHCMKMSTCPARRLFPDTICRVVRNPAPDCAVSADARGVPGSDAGTLAGRDPRLCRRERAPAARSEAHSAGTRSADGHHRPEHPEDRARRGEHLPRHAAPSRKCARGGTWSSSQEGDTPTGEAGAPPETIAAQEQVVGARERQVRARDAANDRHGSRAGAEHSRGFEPRPFGTRFGGRASADVTRRGRSPASGTAGSP